MYKDVAGWILIPNNALAIAQLLAAAVTAIATIALWRVTRVLAVETAVLAKMTSRPFVVCVLESGASTPRAMNLVFRNTGNATAFDIVLELSPGLQKFNQSATEVEAVSTRGLSLLAPGHSMQIQGVLSTEVHAKKFNATISWAAMPNAAARETLSYSFEPKDGFRGGWGVKGIHHVADELGKIRERLEKN
jgi:hypothetical protein